MRLSSLNWPPPLRCSVGGARAERAQRAELQAQAGTVRLVRSASFELASPSKCRFALRSSSTSSRAASLPPLRCSSAEAPYCLGHAQRRTQAFVVEAPEVSFVLRHSLSAVVGPHAPPRPRSAARCGAGAFVAEAPEVNFVLRHSLAAVVGPLVPLRLQLRRVDGPGLLALAKLRGP
jgi:hypothetical protein